MDLSESPNILRNHERNYAIVFLISEYIMNISLLETIKKIIPLSIQNFIAKRFDNTKITAQKSKDQPSFDLIRASVNLMVSSILISFATSLKLPLSTTYVTFMVAMGT